MNEYTKIISPVGLLERITQELGDSLTPAEIELLGLVGLSDFLAVTTVVNRERVAGRLCASHDKAEKVAMLIATLGLHCRRSELDLWPQPDLIDGKVKHHAVYIPSGTREEAWAILYFALDSEFAKGAEMAEFNKEFKLVGRLFGYPDCCAEFFLQNEGIQEDRTPSAIKAPGPFPSILNPLFSELYGFSLHFHFACSPACPPSLQIVRKRLRYLCKIAPSAALLEKLGAGISIYGPQVGALLATRYSKIDDTEYSIDELTTESTKSATLFDNSPQPLRLRLHSAHDFEIGGRCFHDKLHFAAVFV